MQLLKLPIAAYKQYHSQGFKILGVSTVVKFVKERNISWPQILDYGNPKTLNKRYGLQGIPFSLLIGKDGKIAAVNPTGEKLEPALKAELAK